MVQISRKPLERGYVQVYTGNCKGKTTAALGLAFRAIGSGLRTYVGQFMKGQHYGELKAARLVEPYVTIEQYGRRGFMHVQDPPEQRDLQMAEKGTEKASHAIVSGRYDIIILDEIITAHHFHLVSIQSILDLIAQRPGNLELVLTGRYAPQELIDAADLVTEMVEIKHYYAQGVGARNGIEC
jgi:cob(I)alamin adenosyltransferase